MTLEYRRQKTIRIGNAELEYWQAFREIGRLVYREGEKEFEFDTEWFGGRMFRRNWLWVSLPAHCESLASTVHLALCLAGIPNTVTIDVPSPPWRAEEREAALRDFTEWMTRRNYRVLVTRTGSFGCKMHLKRRGLRLSRTKPSADEILARGKWAARAFEALHTSDSKETVLYISEGANHAHCLVSLEW